MSTQPRSTCPRCGADVATVPGQAGGRVLLNPRPVGHAAPYRTAEGNLVMPVLLEPHVCAGSAAVVARG